MKALLRSFGLFCLTLALAWPPELLAQDNAGTSSSVTPLSLPDAIEIALTQGFAIRSSMLELDDADAQVSEARSGALPRIALSSSYIRNLKTANPFAGSSAGNLFSGLNSLGWLAYNEGARTDGNASTSPLSLIDFVDRQAAGLDAAGLQFSTNDNPFAVDNQFSSGLSISQNLFDNSVFQAIKAAKKVRSLGQANLSRQQQLVVRDVSEAFYASMLARESLRVIRNSKARTEETLEETSKQVKQGTLSKFDRLSSEVELANLESQELEAQNRFEQSLFNLKQLLALPANEDIELRGTLESEIDRYATLQSMNPIEATELALQARPDLRSLEVNEELLRLQEQGIGASRFPALSAFANFNYTGAVPDDRLSIVSDPSDPFSFSGVQNGFFSQSYWNPGINVGLQLNWTIFDGRQTRARMTQSYLARKRVDLNVEQLQKGIAYEVRSSIQNLLASQRRISSQDRNVERAELNYDFAKKRLAEGVSGPLVERQASELLDQSRLNRASAIHDFLVASIRYQTALGTGKVVSPDTQN